MSGTAPSGGLRARDDEPLRLTLATAAEGELIRASQPNLARTTIAVLAQPQPVRAGQLWRFTLDVVEGLWDDTACADVVRLECRREWTHRTAKLWIPTTVIDFRARDVQGTEYLKTIVVREVLAAALERYPAIDNPEPIERTRAAEDLPRDSVYRVAERWLVRLEVAP